MFNVYDVFKSGIYVAAVGVGIYVTIVYYVVVEALEGVVVYEVVVSELTQLTDRVSSGRHDPVAGSITSQPPTLS